MASPGDTYVMSEELAKQQSTALSKQSQADLDAQILLSAEQLEDLANTLSPELKEKVLTISTLTRPGIAGIEGKQRTTIPFVAVRQASSNGAGLPEDTKVGELYSVDGTIGPRLAIIPILAHDIRKKWGEEKMECQSVDGITGTVHGACGSCPYGRYEEGVKTQCSKGTAIYGVAEDLSALYRIDFTKTSASAGKNLLRLARPPALWSRSFAITTEKKTANKGTYYELKTALTGTKTSAETMRVCDTLHGFFKALYERAKLGVAAQIERQAAQAATGGGVIDVKPNADGVIDFSDGM